MEKSTISKIVIGAVVVGALVAGFFYWQKLKNARQDSYLPDLNIPGNPIEGKIPDTNPVDKTNPFKSIYKNPFSQ